jgi:hypothetical protein
VPAIRASFCEEGLDSFEGPPGKKCEIDGQGRRAALGPEARLTS